MLRFLFNKIKNKLWINICLLLGMTFFIGMLTLNPVYQEAALQKMLQARFEKQQENDGLYPATASTRLSYLYADGFSNKEFASENEVNDEIAKMLYLKATDESILRMSDETYATTQEARENDESKKKLKLCSLTGMEEHIRVLAGESFGEEILPDGAYSCMVSMQTISKRKIAMGDVLTFQSFMSADGKPLKLKVVGVFGEQPDDHFFVHKPSEYEEELFLPDTVYQKVLQEYPKRDMKMTTECFLFLDYTEMKYTLAPNYLEVMKYYENSYSKKDNCEITFNFNGILEEFEQSEGKVKLIIWILQVPVLVLMLVFIFTVSRQILEMEESEIAMLKSRGVRRYQLVLMYFEQSLLLSSVGVILGIPFAFFLCKVVGASNSFMEFVSRRSLSVHLSPSVFLYAFGAALTASAFMTLPVIGYSRTGIVEQKRKGTRKRLGLGGRLLIGAGILGFSIYEWWNFTNQQSVVAQKVSGGATVDPILFFSSSLFILGGAIVVTILIQFVVRLVFLIFQNRMSPALFASYLQILRSGQKQFVISIFLLITIALGIYNSNMARTINENEEEGLKYISGTDVVVLEAWKNNKAGVMFDGRQLKYEEPDYGKYGELIAQSESVTRVIRDEDVELILDKKTAATDVDLMAIHTKDFGNTAWMRNDLMEAHWYEYLNLISQNPKAILISKNLSEDFGVDVGSTIHYARKNMMKQDIGSTEAIVYGILDYFPTYDGSNKNYLIVANYSQVINSFDMKPYEIWFKTKGDSTYIHNFIEQNQIPVEKFVDESRDIIEIKNDPIFQATNGLLTISFIMILVLCIIGFLIYWILTIHSRELVYGIFRAMGVSMREIIVMLVNEQLYCSCVSLIAGTLIGVIASKIYIPLVEISYSSFAHMLPIRVINRISDLARVGIITVGMILVCILILGWILRKLNITQALKLGED